MSEIKSECAQEKLSACEREWILESVRGTEVLDVGCGRGTYVCLLAAEGKNVIGIDYDRKTIFACKKATASQTEITSGKARFICGDFLDFDFFARMFDSIIFSNVLHEQDDPTSMLRQAEKLLSPYGRLIIITPLTASGQEKDRRIFI